MRLYSLVVISALIAGFAYTASSGHQAVPEPSESEMKSSFGQFVSQLEAKPASEVQFVAFEKRTCRPATPARYHCSFTYSMNLPPDGLSILLPRGSVSGMFFPDADGHLRFEMVIG
jgi:hypothetical protein